uniref:Uncharacterized protein n=2 Tax=Anguilla anguilla TaxID=7936 RepID=A0A0E9RZU5_ANGAN
MIKLINYRDIANKHSARVILDHVVHYRVNIPPLLAFTKLPSVMTDSYLWCFFLFNCWVLTPLFYPFLLFCLIVFHFYCA